MKVVILAGGFGTRISEESHLKPKPMIEIGGRPILWHIMKMYSYYGFHEFIICLGYKAYCIKEYFAHYFLHEADITFDFANGNSQHVHMQHAEPWKVTLVNTGLETMTGGRIKRVQSYIGNESFMLTYGDGVSDVDIGAVVKFHESHGKKATVTSVQPSGRFGLLTLNDANRVTGFCEKPQGDGGWINGGFFVLEPTIFDYLKGDHEAFEAGPLERLARESELVAYKHTGFWQAMDTMRDKEKLEELWKIKDAPWRKWSN